MKKLLCYSLFASALVLFFSGCGKKTESVTSESTAVVKPKAAVVEVFQNENRTSITFDDIKAFFNPDFSASAVEELDAGSSDSGNGSGKSVSFGSGSSKKSKEKSESIIPGLRKLNEYKTEYSTEKPSLSSGAAYETQVKEMEQEIASADAASFKIEDWGPQNAIAAENEAPTFYVVFSQPVHRISALEEPSAVSEYLKVEPALKGVFRWYGSKMLAFECEEAADPAQKYTLTVTPGIKALSGAALSGQTVFTTKAADVKIIYVFGGYEKDSNYNSGWNGGLKPPFDKRFYVRLNYAVNKETAENAIIVKINNQRRTFEVEPDYDETHFKWAFPNQKGSQEKGRTNSYIVTLNGTIPSQSSVDFYSGNTLSDSFNTLESFHLTNIDSYTGASKAGKKFPLSLRFNQPVDAKTVADNITIDWKEDFKLTEDNFSVNDNVLTIYNLPFAKNEKHKITLQAGLKDIYGQSFDYRVYKYSRSQGYSQKTYEFTVAAPASFTKFLDYGAKIMEAQFPHKLIFEYQNIKGGKYYIGRTSNPLNYTYNEELFYDEEPEKIDPLEEDIAHFEEIELDPYLTDGYGFVKFQANVDRNYYDEWDKQWEEITDTDNLTVQVTDLGVTARIGINKAAVLVTSLQTGKPVSGATVELYGKIGNTAEDIDSSPFASGTTDNNGLAVITYTEEQFNQFKKYAEYLNWAAPVVKVINGPDKTLFQPDCHWSYGSGVNRESYKKALSSKRRTFMFVDRGLYRPGETVTFRGIDRTQELGQLLVNHGDYTIKIVQNIWNGKEVCEPVEGTLSESGGFYGSFKVPEDLEPGSYALRYSRKSAADDKTNEDYEQITFTVAEFERLKFETAAAIPDMTYYGGDSVSASISASYLAGGALNNAGYESTWYRSPVSFTSEIPEAKGFKFGPKLDYSSRIQHSGDKGQLSAEGTASLLCKTDKITNGIPQLYRASATITDLSNQSVSTSCSVMVHPALYYAGLKRSGSGFAEKGKKQEISYVLVNPEGQLLEGNIGQKVQKLEYKLTHTEWKYVNEQSVDNTVYTRFTSEEVEDAAGQIDITKAEGSFTILPEKAGWYTLKVTGLDTKNNYVETDLSFYVSGSDYSWWSGDSENIKLTTSQSMYNPGDKAQLLMESPLPEGDYLITVEREGIFTQEIRHIDSSATVLEIPVSKNYVPVVYVSVASYSVRKGEPTHSFGQVDMDKPKGYYGCVPVFVNPAVKAFSINIECDKPTYKPGEAVEITLTATKGGKPFKNAELTLMAVDRGVLDLIDYHVSNPIDYFYSSDKYPLSVFGGDSRALIMDPVIYSAKSLAGGDAEETDEEKEEKRKDFRPTAVFEPVLITDENGKAVCHFTMPDNLTTYRITSFGVSNDLFALSEAEVKVQNPVNVSVVKPLKLRERDTAEFGVLLTNLDKDGHKMKVSVEVQSAAAVEDSEDEDTGDGLNVVAGKAFVDGETEHQVYVASCESSVVYFDLAAVKEGTVNISFHISSDILNEEIDDSIEIEKTYVYETVTTMDTLSDRENHGDEQLIIPGVAKDGQGEVSVTLDATRLGLLGNGVDYLFEYPYGCLEQQSSRLLPLILFEEYIDVFGLDSKVTNPKKVVKKYMKQIAKSQKKDGGFPYWPDGNYSSYAVSLNLAKIYQAGLERGYTKSDLAIDYNALLNYISTNRNQKWTKSYKPQVCYILAKAGRTSIDSTINTLLKNMDELSLSDICYLGLASVELENASSVDLCAKTLRQYLVQNTRAVSVTEKITGQTFKGFWNTDSDSQILALMLKFFTSAYDDASLTDLAGKIVYTLMRNQQHGYWKNTYTTAQVLDGIYTYIKQLNLDNTNYVASASVNGTVFMKEGFKGVDAKAKTLVLPFEGEILAGLPRDKPLTLNINKEGEGNLFYTVSMNYALSDELQAARDEGIKVIYEIRDYETDEIVNKTDAATNQLMLESGKLYKASVRLQSNKNLDYVALRAPVPSGAEILDSTFVTTGDEAEITTESSNRWGHTLSNKTIYANEIQFFWDDFSAGSATVSYTFRASRRGVYPVPPVQAECMYEPEVFGRSSGYLAEIK